MQLLDKFDYTCKAYFQQSAVLPEQSAMQLAFFRRRLFLDNESLLTTQLETQLMEI
jgi:hypothetical protein